jgi:hypothetical protein
MLKRFLVILAVVVIAQAQTCEENFMDNIGFVKLGSYSELDNLSELKSILDTSRGNNSMRTLLREILLSLKTLQNLLDAR